MGTTSWVLAVVCCYGKGGGKIIEKEKNVELFLLQPGPLLPALSGLSGSITVQWQSRVASGEKLPSQTPLSPHPPGLLALIPDPITTP